MVFPFFVWTFVQNLGFRQRVNVATTAVNDYMTNIIVKTFDHLNHKAGSLSSTRAPKYTPAGFPESLSS